MGTCTAFVVVRRAIVQGEAARRAVQSSLTRSDVVSLSSSTDGILADHTQH